MKILVTDDAFYKKCIRKPGDIIEYDGVNAPVWGKEIKNSSENLNISASESQKKNEDNFEQKILISTDGKTPVENENLDLKLEKYKDIGIEYDILIDDSKISKKEALSLFEAEFNKKGISF